mmetsp:Transcript_8310/g.27956  ORF Transcript_8310/g.27956 Transcript_8310/m.27956 type:complete len:96 (+) Transcript_8310:85-372(+)
MARKNKSKKTCVVPHNFPSSPSLILLRFSHFVQQPRVLLSPHHLFATVLETVPCTLTSHSNDSASDKRKNLLRRYQAKMKKKSEPPEKMLKVIMK